MTRGRCPALRANAVGLTATTTSGWYAMEGIMKRFEFWIIISLLTLIVLLLAHLAAAETQVRGNTHSVSVWRNHHVLAASTDGYTCYGTSGDVACHGAVPRPTYRE